LNRVAIAIVGAGPYGLSLAAHLAARNIEHRIFSPTIQFWSEIAAAGGERYLKSYCFGTNISTPTPGFSFVDYCKPRGLETFEPCSIADFAAYGRWFQQNIVPWVESAEVAKVDREPDGFVITLATGERDSRLSRRPPCCGRRARSRNFWCARQLSPGIRGCPALPSVGK
jgi:FAD-dependent urate hydroxylase